MNKVVNCIELPVFSFSTSNNCCDTAFTGGKTGLVPGKPLGVSCLSSSAYAGAIIIDILENNIFIINAKLVLHLKGVFFSGHPVHMCF